MNNIHDAILYLQTIMNIRLVGFFNSGIEETVPFPDTSIEKAKESFSSLLPAHQLNSDEYVIVLLALAPHLQPAFLDSIIQQHLPAGGEFPEIGGIKGTNHRSTLPTGETALFILAGTNMDKRLEAMKYFSPDHFFRKEAILYLEDVKEGEPRMSGRLILEPDYVDLLTTGTVAKPVFGPLFPARPVTTKMDWEDIVLNAKTAEGLKDLKTWLQHNKYFREEWGMERKIKQGYKTLFYGPPGTGKTLTASLLGKQFKKEVYRVDLSQVVSKYIGETEKNLEKIFAKAENRDWILFF